MSSLPAPLTRWWCNRRGHRWEQRSLACLRCHRTAEEILRGDGYDPVASERESVAYWRGVADGRKLDRRRAYRLGYMRGGRDVFGRVKEILRA